MNIESIKFLQENLSQLVGVSGYEDDVSRFILNLIKEEQLADKAWIDQLGNVLAVINGTSESPERILIDAHIDEIGFMVTHVHKTGFLRFAPIGGWDSRILLGQSVIIRSESGKLYNGIIGSKPPHLTTASERKKLVDIKKMYIDIGMFSKEEVEREGIKMGVTGTLSCPFLEFPNDMVRGKAFDDRTGCNVLIHIMRLIKEKPVNDTILFNFAVQEEIGGRGAITGAFTLKPTIAIAIENTTAADVPGIKDHEIPAFIGQGPAITIADVSVICNPKVNKRLIKNAELAKITYQMKKPLYGGTDAGKIHISREGVPSTVVSVPCRYIHSPTSLLKLEDILHTIELIDVFIRNPANVKI